jgi:hypothetical protein
MLTGAVDNGLSGDMAMRMITLGMHLDMRGASAKPTYPTVWSPRTRAAAQSPGGRSPQISAA